MPDGMFDTFLEWCNVPADRPTPYFDVRIDPDATKINDGEITCFVQSIHEVYPKIHHSQAEMQVPNLAKVKINDGDTIVVSFPGVLPQKSTDNLIEQLRVLFPGTRVIVLENGLKFDVISKNEED